MIAPVKQTNRTHVVVEPGQFEPERHFYARVLNAQIHPMVQHFYNLGPERIAERYVHLHPEVDPDAVRQVLRHRPRHFRWGGCDLFHVTTARGVRRIIVIETNSSPSGQKSMPFSIEVHGQESYRRLLEYAFLPMLKRRGLPDGGLAVLYDKNFMETSGYAATLADLTSEPVHLVPFHHDDPDPPARFTDKKVLEVRTPEGAWTPIRAAFRYVTQQPWSRIPPMTRTAMLNPVVVCLAGGRNKALAAKAYDLHNATLRPTGLTIRAPETIWDVSKREVPMWVERMGGVAVVKVPYGNAGQGVYTITGPEELDAFMKENFRYDRFIVQGLVGNFGWSSETSQGQFYHVGTVPNRRMHYYVADLRFMVGAGPDGFFPVALYARRARTPLSKERPEGMASWSMLGTNLSVRQEGGWATEPERLLLMDQRDFNRLGLGLDDLIEGYLQTVLSVTAIDAMAQRLVTQKRTFRHRTFASFNHDPALADEILR